MFVLYLAVSVLLWWGAWSTHPSSVTTCGCGDTALFLWFLEWPAYAIAHGHNPLYSTALFHPEGINLLANTSVLAVGIPLAPVTWLWGPVASLNVASTLAPALSATAMFWLLRRWVSWTPAAFVGGLAFGFSPFVVVNLAGAHLMTGVLVLIPLMLACLDEILLRQQRGALGVGVALGLLCFLEFFVSTEMLAIVAVCAVVGLLLLLVYGAVTDPNAIAVRAPHALKGLAAALVSSGCLLAYPLWFALDGPAHFSGLVWPSLGTGADPAHLSSLVDLQFMSSAFEHQMRVWGGYQGPRLPLPEYIGIGALVVVALALVAWRGDRRLWFFAALGTFSVYMSLGLAFPWHLMSHLPVLQNVFSGRFEALTALCVGVLVAVAVDRTWRAAGSRVAPVFAFLAAGVVAAVALVPAADADATNTPITTTSVVLPQWFAKVGPKLSGRQVVLAYPAPFTVVQSAMAWQAVDLLRFAMVGGGGPEGIASRAGEERAGFDVVSQASLSLTGPPSLDAADVSAVRSALRGWGVTIVVVPNPAGLPQYDQGTNVTSAVRLFTQAVGASPSYVDRAWVWTINA